MKKILLGAAMLLAIIGYGGTAKTVHAADYGMASGILTPAETATMTSALDSLKAVLTTLQSGIANDPQFIQKNGAITLAALQIVSKTLNTIQLTLAARNGAPIAYVPPITATPSPAPIALKPKATNTGQKSQSSSGTAATETAQYASATPQTANAAQAVGSANHWPTVAIVVLAIIILAIIFWPTKSRDEEEKTPTVASVKPGTGPSAPSKPSQNDSVKVPTAPMTSNPARPPSSAPSEPQLPSKRSPQSDT